MPGGLNDTKEILKFIKDELSEDCLVNLMDQHSPAFKAFEYKEISMPLVILNLKKQKFRKKLG